MIKEKIKTDLIRVLKEGDMFVVGALRFLLSEIKNEEIARRRTLTDEEVVSLLRSQLKKRKEAIELFKKGEREDLVDKEQKEVGLIKKYLPASLSEDEVRKKVKEIISQASEKEKSNFGLLMGRLMKDLKGKAEGQTVSQILKEEIAND